MQDSLVGLGTTGKVVASGPNDRVFVYFSDHGAPGTPSAAVHSHSKQLRVQSSCVVVLVHFGDSNERVSVPMHSGGWSRFAWLSSQLLPHRDCLHAGILGMPFGPFLYGDQIRSALRTKAHQK